MFVSSKNSKLKASLKEALLNPLSSDGGLYSPSVLTKISVDKNISYNDLALVIYKTFSNEFINEFKNSLDAYLEFDYQKAINIVKLNDKAHICELFLGKTRAFKDLALAPLARFMSALEDNLLIMCATSGDTGPATLSAFNNLARTICIYPHNKTSVVQQAQMGKIKYNNSLVLAIDGNFDDAQSALKELLNDADFKNSIKEAKLNLSAANSLNFGRILYQIIYHYYASLKYENKINIAVPSGNFGNALAAFYAKMMGANINKIKIISNENCVLYDFFNTGCYDLRKREFKCTLSPAMDILKSSNLERLIFYFFGDERTASLYKDLNEKKYFTLSKDELNKLKEHFIAYKCSDDECLKNIKKYSDVYLFDPHTATTLNALDDDFTLLCASAQWCKFTPSICKALDINKEEKQALFELSKEKNCKISDNLLEALNSNVNYAKEIKVNEIKEQILNWIKG
ncbi:threonine synthase [Campylobacter canadensis]|uniref:threonine synthase n=1 Tax=Campylobacter canadensis TaxID=449520 RepID=UPI00155499F2|nr:threonine synthase [Campylobacter canadensis]MBZ7994579.1 threonine synthase [Campylobacter canadensis]MBZ7996861.1 threonine synthase [Campylobacter canadensis]MBZ7999910.1 threonine synthase [Campylobacter canadensis]MBZ8001762.1 threonine synthase [Campylobacter canadensis]MBZ8004471.1 threonine synthase [Campylobacter canadensis]